MTNSLFQSNELSVLVYSPLWGDGAYQGDYSQQISGYGHQIASIGGFLSADMTLTLPLIQLTDWMENGLGRRVVVSANARDMVWEGLINTITVDAGGFHLQLGPYLDIANKLKAVYSFVDTSTGVPIVGGRAITDYVSDAESIARYGTLIQILSAGGVTQTNVTDMLNMTLDRLKRPPRSEDLSTPGGDTFDIKIECVGYVRMLEKYPYSSTALTSGNLSTQLAAILSADPNSILGADLSGITANTLQVSNYLPDPDIAWGIIKGLIALGDASYNRYIFGVYENRRAVYAPAGATVQYYRPLREGSGLILNEGGGVVYPWQVRPGGWVYVTDFLPAAGVPHDLDNDPRALFVESVSFKAPDSLTINGAHSFKIEQRLAQLGLAGIGV